MAYDVLVLVAASRAFSSGSSPSSNLTNVSIASINCWSIIPALALLRGLTLHLNGRGPVVAPYKPVSIVSKYRCMACLDIIVQASSHWYPGSQMNRITELEGPEKMRDTEHLTKFVLEDLETVHQHTRELFASVSPGQIL